MKDQYLVRRDVLDRIHQNPNAVPIVYPDEFGAILNDTDVVATARDTVARLGLPALSDAALSRLGALDKKDLLEARIKGNRDLIGYLDKRDYDNDSAESLAAWSVLWDAMRNWDNRQWDWKVFAAGVALIDLFCPVVVEAEQVVLAQGSVAH
ncbi:MAG TPA: hypothetical protein VFE42_01225 [Chloroflexota bacterium]|nr:hypothetical protein [Chloroflexota bacterium]